VTRQRGQDGFPVTWKNDHSGRLGTPGHIWILMVFSDYAFGRNMRMRHFVSCRPTIKWWELSAGLSFISG
jgi:hypothetical protein